MSTSSSRPRRTRTRKPTVEIVDSDKDATIKNYEKTINTLLKQIEDSNKLKETLLEEQESNEKEFEKVCKQINVLKKKLSEEEERNDILQDYINKLQSDNNTLLEEYNMCDLINRRKNFQKELDHKEKELDDLQLKYSEILLKSTQKSSIKKGFIYLKITWRKKRNLKAKLKRHSLKIKKLLATIRLMEKELTRRDETATAFEEECDMLLKIVQNYEQDLKSKEIAQERVQYVDTQLIKLKSIIEELDKKTYTDSKKICDNKTIVGISDINIQSTEYINEDLKPNQSHKSTALDSIQNQNNFAIRSKKIRMFSDSFGKNMACNILKHLPETFTLVNSCKPNGHWDEIVKGNCVNSNEMNDDIIVYLIGTHESISPKPHEYLNTIKKLAESLKIVDKKLVISTIAYTNNHRRNQSISNFNSKLYVLASLLDNLHVVDLNEQRIMRKQDYIGRNIAMACQQGLNNSNLTLLVDDTINYPPKNFQKIPAQESVK